MTNPADLARNIRMGAAHATQADILAIIKAKREEHDHPSVPTPKVLPEGVAFHPMSLSVAAEDAPTATPLPTPAPAVSDDQLGEFLRDHLPALIEAATDLVKPPFAWSEVWKLGAVVSGTVSEALPLAKGAEARAIVIVVTRYLWRSYAAPLLPPAVRLFSPVLEMFLLNAVELAYQFVIRPKAKPAGG